MSSAAEIVTDAFGLLGVLDINETAPSPTEMTKGLRALNQMIDSWAVEGLATIDQTRTCNISASSAVIASPIDPLTSVVELLRLAPGMNVNGTGIPVSTRILSINDLRREITLDQAATIQGSNVTVTFTTLPFAAKFERGVAALLAMELAPLAGVDNIPAMVVKLAQSGWLALQANFMRIPPIGFDPALVLTEAQRVSVIGG